MHQSSLFNQCHSSSTLAETHSRVNSKDYQGPECSHVPLHCHDQAHHGPPASTLKQEPHVHPSPWSCPVQCCKQACAQLCSLLTLTYCPGFLDCWHLSDHRPLESQLEPFLPAPLLCLGTKGLGCANKDCALPILSAACKAALLLLLPDKGTNFCKRNLLLLHQGRPAIPL